MKILPQYTWRVIWYAQKQYNIKKSAILQIDIDNLLAGYFNKQKTNHRLDIRQKGAFLETREVPF